MVEVSVLSGEMVSGRRLAVVPADAGSVRASLNGDGEVTCEIPLRDRDVWSIRRELISTLEPWRTFLAFQADGQLVEAGPVVGHGFSDESGILSVKAIGLRGLFRRRLVINAAAANPHRATLSYTDLSLGTIGKRLVQRSLANPGGALPIVLPPDEAGSSERSYPGYEFATVGQRLDDLSGVQGGPEFAFEPRITADGEGVEWVMRAGSTAAPLLSQTGDPWVWDFTTRGAVAGFSVQRDGSSRINAAYVTGQGMDEATLAARATNAGEWERGYPLLEAAYSHSTVSRQSTLNSWPPAYLQQGSRPWTTWKLQVERDSFPTLPEYRCGDWAIVHVADHPYLEDGAYRSRIGSIAASVDSTTAALEMVPTLERR